MFSSEKAIPSRQPAGRRRRDAGPSAQRRFMNRLYNSVARARRADARTPQEGDPAGIPLGLMCRGGAQLTFVVLSLTVQAFGDGSWRVTDATFARC